MHWRFWVLAVWAITSALPLAQATDRSTDRSKYQAKDGAQDSSELRSLAEREIRQTGQVRTHSNDVELSSSMLRLEDPVPQVASRGWDYVLGLSLQTFKPSGMASNDLTASTFDMSRAHASPMPAASFGFRKNGITMDSWSMAWGLAGNFAYTTAKGSARFTTGYVAPDSTLSSALVSVDPSLNLRLARWSRLRLNVGGEVGSVNYTQSSSNKRAAFAEHASYYGEALALEYNFVANVSILAKYVHRKLAATSALGLQSDNYALGTEVTW